MGAYASNFRNDSGSILAELTDPTKDDWITAHATASGCKFKIHIVYNLKLNLHQQIKV